MKSIQRICISVVMLLIMTLMFSLFALRVNAQTITDEQLNQQYKVVSGKLIVTLQEHVKLLQMLLIRHLEVRIVHLQAQHAGEGK